MTWQRYPNADYPEAYDSANMVDATDVPVDDALGSVAAQGTLTLDTNPTDGDTMTVDARVYTFEDTLTDVDGNINIGTAVADTQANIEAAFDLSGTAGTDYADSMTAHATVGIGAFASDAAVLTAVASGAAGNSIVTTETFDEATNIFDGATLGTTQLGETDPASNLTVTQASGGPL